MPLVQTATTPIWYADHRDLASHLPVTLVIHGAGGTHLDWPVEIRRLPEANSIVADLPGHGRSPGSGRSSVSAYAADMVALLDALNIPSAIIAGHSMGGAIAQTMAIQYPDRVQGLVLFSTAASLSWRMHTLPALITEWIRSLSWVASWYAGRITSPAVRRRVLQQWLETSSFVMWNDYLVCSRFDVSAHLSKITHPALIIGGTRDNMTPLWCSEHLHKNISNSELVEVEGVHALALLPSERVVQVMRKWLLAREWQTESSTYKSDQPSLRGAEACA